MPTQSHAPVILLTRPAEQSRRFVMALRERFPNVPILISPLLAPTFLSVRLPTRNWTGVIFTSETAVLSAQRIVADGNILPALAYCVGDQTARTAQDAGFLAISAQGDARALRALILARTQAGPLLYLQGREVHSDLSAELNSAGIETVSCISYAQDEQPLTGEAAFLLTDVAPVIAPVFSARTASILARECARIGGLSKLHVIALSAAAGDAFRNDMVTVAERPDAASMLRAIATRL